MKKYPFPESETSYIIRRARERLRRMPLEEKLDLMVKSGSLTPEQARKTKEKLGLPTQSDMQFSILTPEEAEVRKPIEKWFEMYDKGSITRMELISRLMDYALSFKKQEPGQ